MVLWSTGHRARLVRVASAGFLSEAGGYGAGSHPGSLQKRREGMAVPLRCLPLPAYPAQCPLLAVSSPSAYILVPAQVFTPRWAPNEDSGCALLGRCFLGVLMGQGMGLASLGS